MSPPAGDRDSSEALRRIRIGSDGTITVLTGKVELGQGISTAFAQIAAEELEVGFERVRMQPTDTEISPDEGSTVGSYSIEVGGRALRAAAAEVRALLIAAAAKRLKARTGELRVEDGTVIAPSGASVSYWALAGDLPAVRAAGGQAQPIPVESYRLVGTSVSRPDLARKFTGVPSFIQDLELPGMLYGRIARPPRPSARLAAIDLDSVKALPGVVAVVRDGSFLGVVARREEQAARGVARIESLARWEQPPAPRTNPDPRHLLELPSQDEVFGEKSDRGALGRVVQTFQAEYSRPFVAHAALGPSCAVAQFQGGKVTVWSHSFGVFNLRGDLARVLGLADADVRVIHTEGAGSYGRNGADDCALDAALLARAVPGVPVKVQWTREDEFAWEPYGSAMVMRLAAGVDSRGDIVDWKHEVWGHTFGSRPARDEGVSLLAAAHLERPFPRPRPANIPMPPGGTQRNSIPLYDFPNQRIVSHFVPESPVRTSALRSLGGHGNVFAIESFIDELARAVGADPVEYRLRHLSDPRARAVIGAAAEMAGWDDTGTVVGGRGRGIGFSRYKNASCYAAVIVEVEAEHEVRLLRAWAAVDAGLVVNPDGIANQIEGGIIQSASWALKESVAFEGDTTLARNWNDYPILTFAEAPEIEVRVLNRPDQPSVGVGEGAQGPTSAAIANALHDALGARIRDMPFTRDRVISALLRE
jgi:nicotinate dehydrogenase subunit B